MSRKYRELEQVIHAGELGVPASNNAFNEVLWEELQATSVRMLNDRSAALTLRVLTALSFRPVKGRVSGPR